MRTDAPDMTYFLIQRYDEDGPSWIADLNGSTCGGLESDDDSMHPLEFPDLEFATLVLKEMRRRRESAGMDGEFALWIYRVEVRLDSEGIPHNTYHKEQSL